jgi:hypothetical protein
MRLLKRLLGRQPAISQAHVARRAVVVIDKVIFDVGVDALVGGAFVLDKTFRLRFIGIQQLRRRGIIASVQVSDVAESVLFRAVRGDAPLGAEVMKAHSACLAHAVVRELGSQSEAFRALPALEA